MLQVYPPTISLGFFFMSLAAGISSLIGSSLFIGYCPAVCCDLGVLIGGEFKALLLCRVVPHLRILKFT